MKGKRVLITGASSGIGRAAAQLFAQEEAIVYLLCRDTAKAEAAQQEIIAATGNPEVHLERCDLFFMEQIKGWAAGFRERLAQLDVLVHNAGGIFAKRHLTDEGIEQTFALNHLAPFTLTHQLLPLLQAAEAAHIISVSSEAHRFATMDLENLQGEKNYKDFQAYASSKLCNLLFTKSLAERLGDERIRVNALHPGFVATEIHREAGRITRFILQALRPLAVSPEQAAEAISHLVSSDRVGRVTGGYFIKYKQRSPSLPAQNELLAQQVWEMSLRLARIDTYGKP